MPHMEVRWQVTRLDWSDRQEHGSMRCWPPSTFHTAPGPWCLLFPVFKMEFLTAPPPATSPFPWSPFIKSPPTILSGFSLMIIFSESQASLIYMGQFHMVLVSLHQYLLLYICLGSFFEGIPLWLVYLIGVSAPINCTLKKARICTWFHIVAAPVSST